VSEKKVKPTHEALVKHGGKQRHLSSEVATKQEGEKSAFVSHDAWLRVCLRSAASSHSSPCSALSRVLSASATVPRPRRAQATRLSENSSDCRDDVTLTDLTF